MKDFSEGTDDDNRKSDVLRSELKELQDRYQQAKTSIEFARNEEEQMFWERRADGYFGEMEKKNFEFEKLIRKNKNNMSEFEEGTDEELDTMPDTSEYVEESSEVDELPEGSDEPPVIEGDALDENTDVGEEDVDSFEENDAVPEDGEELPGNQSDALEENNDSVQTDVEDESNLSISELRARSEAEAAQKQAEFEEWAEEHSVNRFSDGTPLEGHEDDMYSRTAADADAMEREGLMEKIRYDEMKKAQSAEVSEEEEDVDTEDANAKSEDDQK